MKTERYYIRNDFIEYDMVLKIEITKKEYERQREHLEKSITETVENECPVEHIISESVVLENYTSYIDCYQSGCARTYLYKFICKDGYHFTRKCSK